MTRPRFERLSAYNQWANARLYAAALDLPDDLVKRPLGVAFGSLSGTLNHLLATDRIWLKRITGRGDAPDRLDAILHDDLRDLARARIVEDARIIATVAGFTSEMLAAPHRYHTLAGQPQEQVLGDILAHLFNHQTHHRGQAHACLSILTGAAPPALDLLVYQRGGTAPDLARLA